MTGYTDTVLMARQLRWGCWFRKRKLYQSNAYL